MAKIGIPTPVFPGIKLISELTEVQINAIADFLKNLPIDIEFQHVVHELDSLLKNQNGKVLLQTITSFSDLIEESDEENKLVAQNLTDSYIELSDDSLSQKRKTTLVKNLSLILTNYEPIRDIINSRKIYSKNENNLTDLSIITDLRLIFKEDIEDKNRSAIILHKLYLEYYKEDNLKEIYLTLDIKDLNKLKEQIEKAIQKDQVLRDDYNDVLKIIF